MSQRIITDFFERAKLRAISQRETEALIEALVYAMAVDGDIHAEEISLINATARLVNWRSELTLQEFVNAVAERCGSRAYVIEHEAQLCGQVAERITDPWLAEETFYLINRLVLADGEVDEAEAAFLSTFELSLNLTQEQVERARNRAADEA